MNVEIKREVGYYSVYVDGMRMVDRESLIIAEAIKRNIEQPERREFTESAEVARQICDWYAEQKAA